MDNKEKFLVSMAISNAVIAGLATRNSNFPIYNQERKGKELDIFSVNLNKNITQFLLELYASVKGKEVIDKNALTNYWKDLKIKIEASGTEFLHDGMFRLGVSQKIINLFLKYLWCYGFITKFDFCPIDGIVKGCLNDNSLQDWTFCNSQSELLKYYEKINLVKKGSNQTIAEWELDVWNQSKRIL